MIIKLLSSQVKDYWEIIKYSAIKADEIEDVHISAYSLELLFDLLNEKTACFISFNPKTKEIQRILLVSFYHNEVRNEKIMWFKTLYSFVRGTEKDWAQESAKIYDFALAEGCSSIQTQTKNKDVIALAKQYGFTEDTRNYKLILSS